jgi:hypothetical protein
MSGTRLRARRTSRITEVSGLVPGGDVEVATRWKAPSGGAFIVVCAFA